MEQTQPRYRVRFTDPREEEDKFWPYSGRNSALAAAQSVADLYCQKGRVSQSGSLRGEGGLRFPIGESEEYGCVFVEKNINGKFEKLGE